AGCRAFGVCRCGLLLASQGRAGIACHSRERLAVAGRGGTGGWLRAVCAGRLRLGRIGQGLKLLREAVLDIPFMACSLMKILTFGQSEGYT
ncbi:hypothetical protein, partial [uncultured Ottowia sp.]|uniref:hypothetical protein n=1 Tax=uncultured Ottowia sp. TaxID=543067 RepID=UPI002591C0FE